MSLPGWNADKKLKLTLDSGVIDSNLTNFPVLVNLGTSCGKSSYDASAVFDELTSDANRKKIAFEIGDTGVQCYGEIERWDDANETAQIHVKVPSALAATNSILHLYYDAAHADNTTYIGDTGDAAAQNVWDANFKAVYHMAQDPSGGTDCIKDSTSNANHGTPAGTMTSGDLVDGLIGKAIEFDGTDDFINIGDVFNPTYMTLECLFSTATTGTNAAYALIVDKYSSYVEGALYLDGSDSHQLEGGFYNASWKLLGPATGSLNDGDYHYGALSYDGAYLRLYADSDSYSVAETASIVVDTTDWRIGARWDAESEGGWWPGKIGEVRISDISRSAAWIKATKHSLNDNLITVSLPINTVVSVLEQTYDLEIVMVTRLLEQLYSLPVYLIAQLEQIYGLRMLAILSQPYGDTPVVMRQLLQYYGDAAQVTRVLTQLYDDATIVRATLDQPYAYPEFLQKILEQRYSIAGTQLVTVSEQLYSIQGTDLVKQLLVQPFSLASGVSQLLTYTSHVVVNGDNGEFDLSFYHVNIEATRDQFCMSCEVHLAGQADYMRSRVLDDLTITIDSESFEFFVESKQRNRGHGTAEYTIKGLSKTALLDAPYAEPITDDLSGMASQIVATLATGYTVNWDTVDWHIPDDTLMPADQTPLAIIRTIAAAAGAIIQTEPDGTLTVEPRYPIAVNNWPAAAIDHHLSDALDFFTTGEDYDHRPGYNRYLISDQLTSDDSLRLEEEAITSATKYIRAYQTPWADDFSLRHTGGVWVTIEPLGIEERLIEDEVVEFIAGTGKTSYPIYARVAVEWLQTNLGTVTFAEDGTLQSSVVGESLLKISYRTKCRKYLATDHEDEQVQLVAEGVD